MAYRIKMEYFVGRFMKYLFWNTGRKCVNTFLEELIVNQSYDVIGLAEYTDDLRSLLSSLGTRGLPYYHVDKIGCERIDILTKCTPGNIEHFGETSYYTIKKIPHDTLGFILVAFVHFPSKLNAGETELLIEATKLKSSIEEAECLSRNNKVVVVGDFNMNPFEQGMTVAASLQAVSCRKVALTKNSRIVYGTRYSMFYNPTWNLFGDAEEPSGTYYYDRGGQEVLYWNMFDQVIIRPSLIQYFVHESLKIIKDVNNISLVDAKGRPSVSDHLPIAFEIQ